MSYVLGIDTSCYTTSVAIMNDEGQLVADCRRILQVKAGGRGLQQSEMVFQHTRNLPELFSDALKQLDTPICFNAIGVSAFPRPLPDSYMPAFLVGDGYAKVLALSQKVPLNRISHQESHIFAGVWSANGPKAERFLAVHLSGGTTEILQVTCKPDTKRLDIKILGGSQDIHAGQLVDRIGVLLGLDFPAGTHLETLAKKNQDKPIKIPVSVRNASVSFAGPETHVRKLVAQNTPAELIAASVQLCVARAVTAMIKYAIDKTSLTDVLLVGGVMANQYIRQHISQELEDSTVAKLYFPQNTYSPDNATGAAYFALTSR